MAQQKQFKPTQLSPEQLKEAKAAFQKFDTNGDGSIEESEIMAVMQMLGLNPTKQEVNELLKSTAREGQKIITFDEFADLFARGFQEKDDVRKELQEAFKKFDKDGNGFLDKEELRVALTGSGEPLTDDQFNEMWHWIDENGDGKIDFEEFVKAMMGD